jgi:hypothetical protein
VDLTGAPSGWPVRRVELTGLAEVAPEDPKPEFVSINNRNQVAATLQENNHIAVVDLASGGSSPISAPTLAPRPAWTPSRTARSVWTAQ